jgi:membrane protein DedA with SNARE-associated domain
VQAHFVQSQLLQWLAVDNGFNVHVTVLSLLLLGGFGFPIPEDIPLILAGVATQKGLVSPQAIMITCYVGVLLADQMVYAFGYFFGQRLLQAGTKSPLLPSVTEARVQQIREGLRKKRLTYIFIGRHLFPVRTATFVTAGALRIPFWEFLVADAIAALVSVSIVVAIGHALGGQLTPEVISHLVHRSHYYIAVFTGILVLLICGRHLYKRRKRKRSLVFSPSAGTRDADTPKDRPQMSGAREF